jgi:O-antigen/teichoic acid export membrane protein
LRGSVAGRVAYNTAVQVAGKAAGLALGAVSLALLTRYLGPSDYGKYTLALMFSQVLGVLADVGLYTTVVRDISREPERTEELVGNALTLRLLLAFVLIALAGLVSLALPYTPQVRVAILLAGGPLLLGLLNSSLLAIFQARLLMDRATVADLVGRVAALALVVLVVLLDLGFYAVIGAAAGGALATLAVTWSLTRRRVRLRFLRDTAVWRRLLAASLPLGLALAINELYFRADTVIISVFRPYDEVGAYTLAYRILELALMMGAVLLTTVFPLLSTYARGEEQRLRTTIQRSWDVLVIAAVPVAAGGAVLATSLVELVAGDDYGDAVTPLRVLLAAGSLMLVNGLFGYTLIAAERQLNALWLNLAALAFNIGLNLALVPAYGIEAAALVTVGSEVLIFSGSFVLMRRHLHFFPSPGPLLPALAAAAAMAALLWALEGAPVALLVPLGALVYAGLLAAISPATRQLARGWRT